MDQENNYQNTTPIEQQFQTHGGYQGQKPPLLSKKLLILIAVSLVAILLITTGLILMMLGSNQEEQEGSQTAKPIEKTPQETTERYARSWEMEVIYTPADSSYTVGTITLRDEEFIQQDITNSPYVLTLHNDDGKEVFSENVAISTNFIIPDIFKDSSASAGFENQPITTTISFPHIPTAKRIQVTQQNAVIIDVAFPDNIQSRLSASQTVAGMTTADVLAETTANENTSPNGWKIKVVPVCEDGKIFAEYTYDIPRYAGVIFTHEQKGFPDSLENLDDSSWQRPVGSIILISGKGKYKAVGNLINWDPSMGQLQYNGPVGLRKNTSYRAELLLSGDWTCNPNSGSGACIRDPLTDEYIFLARASVLFDTDIQCEVPTPTSVPTSAPVINTPVPQNPGGTQCRPDPSCETNRDVIQLCPLICD